MKLVTTPLGAAVVASIASLVGLSSMVDKAEATPFRATKYASSALLVVAAAAASTSASTSSVVAATTRSLSPGSSAWASAVRGAKEEEEEEEEEEGSEGRPRPRHGFLHGGGGGVPEEWMDQGAPGPVTSRSSSSSNYYYNSYLRSALHHHHHPHQPPHQHQHQQRFLQAPTSTVCPNPNPAKIRGVFVVSQPTPLGITADGLTGDWDLTTAGFDFVTSVFNAGNADPGDGNYQLVGRLYLRWSCPERKLCALLLANDGYCLSGANYYFKDYGLGNADIPPLSPGFQNVVGTAGRVVGWEACFGTPNYSPPPANLCRTGSTSNGNGVEFHANFGTCGTTSLGNTVSSGRGDDFVGLDLGCPCIAGADNSACNLPPPFPQTTSPTTGTCCGDTCTPPHLACFCACTSSITCPANVTLECGNSTDPANTGTAIATKSGSCSSATQTVTPSDVVSSTSGVCPSKITRTWTATLKCTPSGPVGRTDTCTQVINVRDTKPPDLWNLPANETLECQDPSTAAVTANDTCQAGPITPVLTTTNTPGCGTTKNVTRTWTATDTCGNSATATRLAWIRDTTQPTLVGVPANTGASCDNVPAVATVTATDVCDPSVTPTFVETNNTAVGDCQAGKTINRTWTATDDCLNSDSKTQVITLTDTVKPYFTSLTPVDTEVSCSDLLPPFDTLSAADSCGSATVAKREVNATRGCPQNVTVTRTWTATDLCDNRQDTSQRIYLYDTAKPTLSGEVVNGTFSCEAIPGRPSVTATDNCDPSVTPDFTESNSTSPGQCLDGATITRTWTATDDCGNSDTKVQVLSVTDKVKPYFTTVIPADAERSCEAGLPPFDSLTAADSCGSATVSKSEVNSTRGCPQNLTVTRTWTASDVCNNTFDVSQRIDLYDTTNPTFVGEVVNGTFSCEAIPGRPTVTATDNCDPSVTPDFYESNSTSPGQCLDRATITRTWTATDDCLNSVTQTQVITLTDDKKPYFTNSTPDDTEVRCDATLPPFDSLTAADSCGSANVTKSEVNSTGACPQNITVTRTWTAEDLCRNTYEVSQRIYIYDATKPTLLGVPVDTGASCDSVPEVPTNVTAADSCDPSVTPAFVEKNDTFTGVCQAGKTITRTWTAADDCGNSDTQSQVITLTDTVAPTFDTPAPDSTSVSCDLTLPDFATLTASDSCGSANVTRSEVNETGSCPQNIIVTRTWTAKDLCGNNATATQTITVFDTKEPTLLDVPADTSASCEAIPDPPNVTAGDNCDLSVIPTLVETNDTVVGQCKDGKKINRTWTATDDCLNSVSQSQVITLTDDVKPTFDTPAPGNTAVSCDAALPTFVNLTASDNCGSADVTKSEVNTTGSCPQNKTLTRTWTAKDACGNNATATQTITVYDATKPTLSGVPPDTSVSCDAIPSPPIVTANDTCDHYVVPGLTVSKDVVEGQCKDGKTINRTWTAADDCGNTVTATQTITLTDTKAPVLSGVPANATVQCRSIPTPPPVSGSDSCGGTVNVTMAETNISGVCGNRTVTRVWTGVDVCGNVASRTQVLTLVDTTKPSITCPPDATIACNGCTEATDTCLRRPTVSDNCDASPNVTYSDTYSPATASLPTYSTTDVNQTLTRTFTARDDCGNSKPCTQRIIKTGVLSGVNVSWSINGAVDTTVAITFELYQGPPKGGKSGTLLTSASTLGDVDGVILNGFVNPSLSYTLCFFSPVGELATVTANGVAIEAYNADAASNENLGNYCVDFQPTDCSAVVKIVLAYTRGGGCPRTPGYWKNWNNCSGGKQGATAAKNGGAAKGYFIVEDLLPIVWDDTNSDTKFFSIKNCTAAVQVLSSKTLSGCSASPNTQFASDPVIALAKHLLATQLNAKAKACISANITTTSKLAEKLLDDLNYLGCKLTAAPNATTTARLRTYATILDGYNNGNSCPGCHG